MTGVSSQTKSPYADITLGKSGSRITSRKYPPLFYIVQDFYKAADPGFYGLDPRGLNAPVRFVQVYYQPQDMDGNAIAPAVRVAGFISPPVYDMSLSFRGMAYRYGVESKAVQDSLKSRVEAARRLLETGADEKVDVNRLQQRITLLEAAYVELQTLINEGWSHFAIASGRREVKDGSLIDHLDLNADYFSVFFPEAAFPLPFVETGGTKVYWVARDDFLWGNFIDGQVVKSASEGEPLWNRFEYRLDPAFAAKYPQLHMTFNHAMVDSYNEQTEDEGKMVARAKGWPTIEEKLQELLQNLKNNPQGLEAKKARRAAMIWAYRFALRAKKLRKLKKDKLAETNERACQDLIDAVGDSIENELTNDILPRLKNTDPMSKDLDINSKESIKNIGDLMMQGRKSVEPGGKIYEEYISIVVEKYTARGKQQLSDLEKADPHDKNFKKSVVNVLNTNSVLVMHAADNPILEETTKVVSSKCVEAIEDMGRKTPYDPKVFLDFDSQNTLIGGLSQVSPAKKEELAELHQQKLLDRWKLDKNLDKELKGLINMQSDVFNRTIPAEIASDKNVQTYLKKRAAGDFAFPQKRYRHTQKKKSLDRPKS